jgi:ATP/maltotriose-dependent transcriptional regulator MalT
MANMLAASALNVVLRPLDETAVAAIIADVTGATPDGLLTEACLGARGNPFLVVELLKALMADQLVRVQDGAARLVGSGGLPARFRWTVHTRLEQLPPGTRHLLDVASALGKIFLPEDAASLVGKPIGKLLPSIQAALLAGILTEDGQNLAFQHDLIRQAVYADIPASVRKALHMQIARRFLSSGRRLSAVGHLLIGAQAGDAKALEGLLAAAEEMAETEPSGAADLTMRAVKLVGLTGPRHPELVALAARRLSVAGRLLEAGALARQTLADGLDPSEGATVRLALAWTLWASGEHGPMLEETTLLQHGAPSPEAVAVHAVALYHAGRLGEAQSTGQEATRLGAMARSDVAVSVGSMALSAAAWVEGRFEDLVAHLQDRTNLTEVRSLGEVFAWALQSLDRLGDAEDSVRSGQRVSQALGNVIDLARAQALLSMLALQHGRLDDACEHAASVFPCSEQPGSADAATLASAVLTRVAVLRGQLCEAEDFYRQGRAVAARGGRVSFRAAHAWAAALLADAQAHPELARDSIDEYMSDDGQFILQALEPSASPMMVRIAQRAGDTTMAVAALDGAERLVGQNPGAVGLLAASLHAHGLALHDTSVLRRAVELLRSSPRPWALASAYEDLAVVLAPKDAGQAIEVLQAAVAIYSVLGATRDAARGRRRLRSLGVRKRNWIYQDRPASGWESLTDTEHDVVNLVAAGLSNRVAAEQLFLAPTTVSFHLRNIYRKLDVSGRVDLTRLAMGHQPGK